jgi:two-component system, OmpR family, sensor histidine kinase MtrB
MSIRQILATVLVVTSCFAAAGALALVALTTEMRRSADDLRHTVEGVRIAEELQVALLRHARHSSMVVLGQATELELHVFEVTLLRMLREAADHVRDARERELVEDASRQVDVYLVSHRAVRTQDRSLDAVMAAINPVMERALQALERLTELNIEQAQDASDQARRWNRLSNIIGALVAVVLVGLVPATLLLITVRVLRPLVDVSRAMQQYADGMQHVRLPSGGAIELQRIASSFNHMADALAEQHTRQLTSIGGIAHDLRNPLNALRLATYAAERNPSPEALASTFELVRRQTLRLERMVSDLLDACSIEAGQLELRLQPCDLRRPLSEACDLHVTASPRHRVHVAVPEEPVLTTCDPFRLEQVFNNLLSNAVKYSPDGGSVDVELRVEGRTAVVTVTDEGIGIPQAALQTIFQPFGRLSGRDNIPGTGLGLSVSRRIIDAHRGRIEVFSAEGRGSIFRVSLPLTGAAPDVIETRAVGAGGGS